MVVVVFFFLFFFVFVFLFFVVFFLVCVITPCSSMLCHSVALSTKDQDQDQEDGKTT